MSNPNCPFVTGWFTFCRSTTKSLEISLSSWWNNFFHGENTFFVEKAPFSWKNQVFRGKLTFFIEKSFFHGKLAFFLNKSRFLWKSCFVSLISWKKCFFKWFFWSNSERKWPGVYGLLPSKSISNYLTPPFQPPLNISNKLSIYLNHRWRY